MDNQHRQIKGYRELSQAEIDLMNEIKEEGVRLQALIAKVREHVAAEAVGVDRMRADAAEPARWASIARTDFQTGLMALTRANRAADVLLTGQERASPDSYAPMSQARNGPDRPPCAPRELRFRRMAVGAKRRRQATRGRRKSGQRFNEVFRLPARSSSLALDFRGRS